MRWWSTYGFKNEGKSESINAGYCKGVFYTGKKGNMTKEIQILLMDATPWHEEGVTFYTSNAFKEKTLLMLTI